MPISLRMADVTDKHRYSNDVKVEHFPVQTFFVFRIDTQIKIPEKISNKTAIHLC